MKTKAILQVLAVCFSVTLLSGYVIYAQRRVQPDPVSPPSPESAPGVESQVAQLPPDNPPPAKPVMASSSKRISAVFTSDVFPVKPHPAVERPPEGTSGRGQWTEVVSQRADGSSVTTRIAQDKAPVLAPSSKVLISVFPSRSATPPSTPAAQQNDPFAAPVTLPSGSTVRPESVHHGESPTLLGVIPPPDAAPPAVPPRPPAPVPVTPAQPRQTLIFSTKSAPVFTAPAQPAPQPVQTVNPPANSPQSRMIAPGSKSIDLLLFQKGTAPTPNAPVTIPVPTPPTAPQSALTVPQTQTTRAQQAPAPKVP